MPDFHATGSYVFSIQRSDSTVLAKNHLTMYNPATSGKAMTVSAFFVSFMATVAAPAYPLRGHRFSGTPSGGTLHTVSEICKFDTGLHDPAAELRSNNPTAPNLDGAIFNSPPGTVKDTIGPVHQVDAPQGFNPFVLRPGQGVVLRQDVGAVGLFWNISIIWRELRG